MMNEELGQNLPYDHHLSANFASICWHARKFFTCMANFKNGHLKKRVVDLVKMMDRGVVDLMKIRRFESNHWKSEHYRGFWRGDYTYTS
jgi:hypothetical protein